MSGLAETYLGRSELERIKKLVTGEDEVMNFTKTISQARSKNWSNTVEGSRRLKAETLRRKLEEQENRQQEVDDEENRLEQALKYKTLKRAKDIVQENSEGYRRFIKSQMLNDTISENNEHARIKDEFKKLETRREDHYSKLEAEDYRKKLEREVREKEELAEKNRQTGVIRGHQLASQKDKRINEYEEWYLEGEMIARKAAEDLAAEKLAVDRRRAQAKQALMETVAANDYLKELQAREKEREKAEDRAIADHAKRQDIIKDAMRRREQQIHDTMMATRAALIETQSRRLQELKDTEDSRIAKDVEERRVREERTAQEKLEKQLKQKEMIRQHRELQLAYQADEADRLKQEDLQARADIFNATRRLEAEDTELQRMKRADAKRVAEFQKQQTELRRWKETTQKARDDAFGVRMIERAKRL